MTKAYKEFVNQFKINDFELFEDVQEYLEEKMVKIGKSITKTRVFALIKKRNKYITHEQMDYIWKELLSEEYIKQTDIGYYIWSGREKLTNVV